MAEKVTFAGLPRQYCDPDTAAAVIIPVPFDRTSTWIKGADKGPEAILDASANMELYDIETASEFYKKGIFTDRAVKNIKTPEKLADAVAARVKGYIKKDKFTVIIGGEHSVSIGAIRAYAEKYDRLTVLQLDAHSDLRDEYHGSKCNHACVMARAREVAGIVQVGIRSMDISEKRSMAKGSVFFAEDIYDRSDWINDVTARLSEDVYVTIDLDVFDPSIMPSTGTPEPGGLLWYDVLSLLKQVFRAKNVVGLDVVELCPNKSNKAPDFLAAKLIYKSLSYKFC